MMEHLSQDRRGLTFNPFVPETLVEVDAGTAFCLDNLHLVSTQ